MLNRKHESSFEFLVPSHIEKVYWGSFHRGIKNKKNTSEDKREMLDKFIKKLKDHKHVKGVIAHKEWYTLIFDHNKLINDNRLKIEFIEDDEGYECIVVYFVRDPFERNQLF